jgi:putative ABC transport system permease protein
MFIRDPKSADKKKISWTICRIRPRPFVEIVKTGKPARRKTVTGKGRNHDALLLSFLRDLKVAVHSLARTPGLAITVILTLSLGIGANAAIFTLVRGVLLKPLVNRDENRLIYIRQSAPRIHDENTTFSVPEIQDLRASIKTLNALGDFSTMDFTMVGLGEPRSIQGGGVSAARFSM